MERIRNVDYYHRDLVAPVLLPLAVKYFLTKELKKLKDPLMATGDVLEILVERCTFALRHDLQELPADALLEALAGPLEKSGAPSDRVDELFRAVNAVLPLAYACVHPSVGRSETLVVREYWSLANSLMPFTPTSESTLVKVRHCRICGCSVRDGDKACPFCFVPAPRGKARRAWERKQIRVQQPPAQRGAPAAGPERPADLRWDNPEAPAAGELDGDFGEDFGEIDIALEVEDGYDVDEPEETQ